MELNESISLKVEGRPLSELGLDNLTIIHSDGRKEPFTGLVVWPGETAAEALNRTALEMNATIVYEHQPD